MLKQQNFCMAVNDLSPTDNSPTPVKQIFLVSTGTLFEGKSLQQQKKHPSKHVKQIFLVSMKALALKDNCPRESKKKEKKEKKGKTKEKQKKRPSQEPLPAPHYRPGAVGLLLFI